MSRRKLKARPISSKIDVNRRAKLAINRSLATLNKAKPIKKLGTGLWNRLEAEGSDEENRTEKGEQASGSLTKGKRGRPVSKKRRFIVTTRGGKPYKRPKVEIKEELDDDSEIKKAKPRKGYYDRNEIDVDNDEQQLQDYACEFCSTTFQFQSQFKSHNVNCALKNGDRMTVTSKIVYKCLSCEETFEIFFDYLNHLNNNYDRCVDHAKVRLAAWDACVCVLCGFTTRRSTMMDHLREEHSVGLRSVGEEIYQHCRLCASQQDILTSKSGKFMSALEFFNHLSSWHPRAILLLESVDNDDEINSIEDGSTTSTAVVNCRVCGVEIPKCEFESHVLIEHCDNYTAEDSASYERKLLYDPLLRRRRRAESPPVPFVSACEEVDRETFLKHHRKRCYRWSQFKERRRCSGCGWLGANRNEYLIHVLCNFCKPEYDEFDMRMKCLLCFAVVERNDILTHLCEMHDYELNMKFEYKLGIDESFVNEGRLAREIIGYDWICPHCLVGFDREKKRVQVGHRCRRNLIAENSYDSKALTASLIKICPFCRARLRNDALLKLHHRFEHEEARSGLSDPCVDPGFVRHILESQSDKVSEFMKRVTMNLMNKEIVRSMTDTNTTEDTKIIKCNACTAVFYSYEVYSQHKKIFHSTSSSVNSPRMNEVLLHLHRCHQLRIPFSLPPPTTAPKSPPPTVVKTVTRTRKMMRADTSSGHKMLRLERSGYKQRNLLPKAAPTTVSTLLLKRPDQIVNVSAEHPFRILPKPMDAPVLHYMPHQSPASYADVASSLPQLIYPRKKVAPPVVVNSFSLSNPDDKHDQIQKTFPAPSVNKLVKRVVDLRKNAGPTIYVRHPNPSAMQFNFKPVTTSVQISAPSPTQLNYKPPATSVQIGAPSPTLLNFKPASTSVQMNAPSPIKQTVIFSSGGGSTNLNLPRLLSIVKPHVIAISTQSDVSPITSTTFAQCTVQAQTFANSSVRPVAAAGRDVLGEMLQQRTMLRFNAPNSANLRIVRPSQPTNNDPGKNTTGHSYAFHQQPQPKQ